MIGTIWTPCRHIQIKGSDLYDETGKCIATPGKQIRFFVEETWFHLPDILLTEMIQDGLLTHDGAVRIREHQWDVVRVKRIRESKRVMLHDTQR